MWVVWESYLVHEAYTRGFERILLWKVDPHFPNTTIIWGILRSEKLHYKFIQTIENCHFMFWLDQFDHICVHPPFPSTWRRHFGSSKFCWTKIYFSIFLRGASPSQSRESKIWFFSVCSWQVAVLRIVTDSQLALASPGQHGWTLTVYNTLTLHYTPGVWPE